MCRAGQSLQTKVQRKINRIWKNTGPHLAALQKSVRDDVFVLLASREIPVG